MGSAGFPFRHPRPSMDWPHRPRRFLGFHSAEDCPRCGGCFIKWDTHQLYLELFSSLSFGHPSFLKAPGTGSSIHSLFNSQWCTSNSSRLPSWVLGTGMLLTTRFCAKYQKALSLPIQCQAEEVTATLRLSMSPKLLLSTNQRL